MKSYKISNRNCKNPQADKVIFGTGNRIATGSKNGTNKCVWNISDCQFQTIDYNNCIGNRKSGWGYVATKIKYVYYKTAGKYDYKSYKKA